MCAMCLWPHEVICTTLMPYVTQHPVLPAHRVQLLCAFFTRDLSGRNVGCTAQSLSQLSSLDTDLYMYTAREQDNFFSEHSLVLWRAVVIYPLLGGNGSRYFLLIKRNKGQRTTPPACCCATFHPTRRGPNHVCALVQQSFLHANVACDAR